MLLFESDKVARAGHTGIDVVLIDNAPGRNARSDEIVRLADLTLVMTRPSLFDLAVALDWIELGKEREALLGVVIGDAPPRRDGVESPLVRDAREALREVRGLVWGGQITRRHAMMQSTAMGNSVVELDPSGPAAVEYRRLWASICAQLARKVTA